jgi:hypothetical protein
VNFERHVQAFFLFKMVSRDLCPILEMPIQRMDFQAKYLGYDTDDLVITALSGQKSAKLLCQIGRNIRTRLGDEDNVLVHKTLSFLALRYTGGVSPGPLRLL